jgi:DNA-binding XRE family transcriptional regulator
VDLPLLTPSVPDGALPETVLRMRIIAARKVAMLTQAEMGRAIGNHHNIPAIPQHTVWHWEKTGNVPAVYLGAIAKACGVEFEYFNI